MNDADVRVVFAPDTGTGEEPREVSWEWMRKVLRLTPQFLSAAKWAQAFPGVEVTTLGSGPFCFAPGEPLVTGTLIAVRRG